MSCTIPVVRVVIIPVVRVHICDSLRFHMCGLRENEAVIGRFNAHMAVLGRFRPVYDVDE